MTRNWIGGPPEMDPHAEAIDGFVDSWPVGTWVEAERFAVVPPEVRHRSRATVRGFVLNPLVSLGIIAVCLAVIAGIVWRVLS